MQDIYARLAAINPENIQLKYMEENVLDCLGFMLNVNETIEAEMQIQIKKNEKQVEVQEVKKQEYIV